MRLSTYIVIGFVSLGVLCGAILMLGLNFVKDQDMILAEQVEKDLLRDFHRHINKYHKNYLTKEEYRVRLANFKKSHQLVVETNNRNLSYKLELNEFADMTEEEVRSLT